MYWYGHLAIDPAHLTQVQRRPTKGFRRFAEILSAGMLSEKEELETFTAVAILQDLNRVLRSLQITDLVRFSKDDEIIYEDQTSSDADDMRLLMEQVEDRSRPLGTGVFNTLSLLLEHHLESLALVIEVRVIRAHAVGFYPIQITVNGLAAEFAVEAERDAIEQRLESTFAEQGSYDAFTQPLREQFEEFMNALELACRQQMRIDDLHKVVRSKIIRPEPGSLQPMAAAAGGRSPQAAGQHAGSDPVFERYGAGTDAMFYCWMWSSMLHTSDLHVQDVTVVDQAGQALFEVDSNGFDAGSSAALDPHVPLEEAGIAAGDGILPVDAEISSKSWWAGDAESTEGGGWLGDFGIGDSSSGGDSGASCGSSCGSSCGGGCGGS